jgi:hypothetical protein
MKRRGTLILLAVEVCILASVVLRTPAQEGDALLPPDLSGRWAMVQALPALTALPILGDVEMTMVVTRLVDIEQCGTSLVLRDVYCATDMQMHPPVLESRIPERFLQSLHPAPRTAELQASDDGWDFLQPPVTEIRGAVLADPESDLLPIDPLDPRVIDPDGDGRPGLTVRVTVAGLVSGDTYIVERLRFSLSGRVRDADTIIGLVDWSSEQHVLGASDAVLLLTYTYRPHPDAARHVFAMRRVGPEATCEAACQALPSLLSLIAP